MAGLTATVLVIDDNADNMTLTNYLLRAHGHETALAGSGAEGLALALRARPDLILLDIRMAGMNGYEVAAAIRTHPELDASLIVAMTASVMAEDRERIAEAGFDGYIEKPIEPTTFLDQVERLLRISEFQRKPAADSS